MAKNNLIFNWGINNANYNVSWYDYSSGGKVKKRCPLYMDWYDIVRRGNSALLKSRCPTYADCSVSEDWRYFMDYREWVLNVQPNKQWSKCTPDKDLLLTGNKVYSPETVVYIDTHVNTFLLNSTGSRGECMLGVSRVRGKFAAQCNNPFSDIARHLGYFDSELEAHKAWQAKKHEYALQLADMQYDPRVAEALRKRFAPDTDWTQR